MIDLEAQFDESDLSERNKPYTPYGNFVELFYHQGREVLLSGPAGTGKSLCCLNRIYMLAEQFPGCRCLIARKTRESMTESTLVTWESKVVPEGHPCLQGPSRRNRQSYVFPNGSEVVVGGMKQSGRDATQKVMSTDFDFIYIPEAIELQDDEYGKLVSRLRNNRSSFRQIISDTNPSHPKHWLKRRCDEGLCRMIETRHEDNPLLYDHARGDWTDMGREYLQGLDSLPGALRSRLRYGLWSQAEGVVYANWDESLHVTDPFPIPSHWKRACGVDFGYNDPFVCLWSAQDPDTKRIYVYREYVKTQDLVENHAAAMRILEAGEPIDDTVCDHDREGRATLEKHLRRGTLPANKRDIMAGVDVVQSFLKLQLDGKPLVQFFRTLYDTYDANMDAQKLATGILQEMHAYVWDTSAGRGAKDRPLDRENHSQDCLRYLCMYWSSFSLDWVKPTPIEPLKPIPLHQRSRQSALNLPQFRTNNPHPFGGR